MQEQATPRTRQPWLASQDNYVIEVDKVRISHAASVGGKFVLQSSGKPTYTCIRVTYTFCGEMNFVMHY